MTPVPWLWLAVFALVLAALGPGAAAAGAGAQEPTTAQSIRRQIDDGHYAAAETAADVLVGALPATTTEGRAARRLLVEALLRNGRGQTERARSLARGLVEHADAEDRGLNERLLGLTLLESAQYRDAGTHLSRALRHHERAVGPRHPRVADDLDALTELRLWLEDYDGAVASSARALAIRSADPGTSTGALAGTLEIRALVWQRRSDVPRARVEIDRARRLREAADPTHPALVRTLTLEGDQLRLENQREEALAVLRRAVALADRALREGHPERASAMRALASVVHRLPAHAEAKGLRERALAVAEAAYGPTHPLVAIQLNDLAISFEAIGDFGTSRQLMRRALDIYERALGPSYSGVITAVYNLGNRHAAIGDYDEAIRLFRRAATTWNRVVGPAHRYMAFALAGLGDALSKTGRHAEAVAALERALRIRETHHGSDSVDAAELLLLLAESRWRAGDYRRASTDTDRAIRIWEGARDTDSLAEAFLVRARIAAAVGDSAAARAAAERALSLALPLFGASHPKIGAIKAQLAEALVGLGETSSALSVALDAERIGREHVDRTLANLPERQALAYVAERPRGFSVALSALTADAPSDAVYEALVRGRSLTVDEMAARRRTAAQAVAPNVAPLWTALLRATERLTELAVRGPGNDPAAYQRLLVTAQRERERAETALADASADVRQAVSRRVVGPGDVQAALPAATALVSFVRFERPAPAVTSGAGPRRRSIPEYAAFVLRAEGAPTLVRLGEARAIERAVAEWRVAVVAVADPQVSSAGAEAALRRIGRGVRRRVWDPVAPLVSAATQVFVVPDGTLNLLPFAALPTDGLPYLVEVGPTIHYLSAERDLVAPTQPGHTAKGLLAIGGPAYGVRQTAERAAPTATVRAPSCGSFEDVFFPALPAALREAQEVSALWRRLAGTDAAGVDTLVGGRASEAAFKRLGPGRRILHVATHGFFLGSTCEDDRPGLRSIGRLNRPGAKPAPTARLPLPENPLLWSGLALAGANRRATRPAADDGILTAEEVAGLDLDGVEWAVLSACDTGIGEITVGEGVFGLRRAFRVAGARTVVMSLWEVDDQAARAWMRRLYEGRLENRLPTADAVRHAALTVLRERRARRLSTHPFYWAAFVAAGDWR